MEEKKVRKNWIDSAKAIAILIVVLNHSDLRIPGVNFWGGMFFVSAFFVLSGYTYHVSDDDFSHFVIKKAKRLLAPYLLANCLLVFFFAGFRYLSGTLSETFLLRSLVGIVYGRNQVYVSGEDPVYLMLSCNAPTWFLPALFLTLVMMEWLQRLFQNNEKKVLLKVVALCCVATAYHYFGTILLPWCMDLMPYFLLMMMAGYYLKTTGFLEGHYGAGSGVAEHKTLSNPLVKAVMVLGLFVICIVSALLNGSFNLSLGNTGKSVTLMCLSAVTSSVLLMFVMLLLDKKVTFLSLLLAKLGKHTLTILCYHFFVMQMTLTVFQKANHGMFLSLQQKIPKTELDSVMRSIGRVEEILAMAIAIAVCVIADVMIHKVRNRVSRSE